MYGNCQNKDDDDVKALEDRDVEIDPVLLMLVLSFEYAAKGRHALSAARFKYISDLVQSKAKRRLKILRDALHRVKKLKKGRIS